MIKSGAEETTDLRGDCRLPLAGAEYQHAKVRAVRWHRSLRDLGDEQSNGGHDQIRNWKQRTP
jgi:hypothetical protein